MTRIERLAKRVNDLRAKLGRGPLPVDWLKSKGAYVLECLIHELNETIRFRL